MKAITRTIWLLSLVSLFNDIASEMLLPIMPIYLKSIGFSIFIIGVLEGLAEAVSSLSKGYFGKLSDQSGHRAIYVKWGYALSAISKPMMILFVNPVWVFFSRTLERFGKGIRTAPRDAILADESAHSDRGRVFGFHRSMDTIGAAIGPSIALAYLYFHHEQYKTLFYIAFFPGILVVLMTLGLKDPQRTVAVGSKTKLGFFSQFRYWKESTPEYKALVSGLLFFALFNSADAFLILKMKEAGLNDTMVIIIYIFYNLVFALTSFPIGIIGDKVSLKTMMLIGLLLFTGAYFGMAFSESKLAYFVLFFCYGLYYACTDGISKAWISKVCEKKDTGTALGVFSGLQSICTFIASSLAGFIWYKFGSIYVFIIAGSVAFVVMVYLTFGVTYAKTNKAD
jgi:MFS family permease